MEYLSTEANFWLAAYAREKIVINFEVKRTCIYIAMLPSWVTLDMTIMFSET